jgi:hypothetical protein
VPARDVGLSLPERYVQIAETLFTLLLWVGAATRQPSLDLPPIVMVPPSLMHYEYCQAIGASQQLDDCLAERFWTAAFFDATSDTLYLSRHFEPSSLEDRASLIVQLARHAGEAALIAAGPRRDTAGTIENAVDCGLRFEATVRNLARSYLVDNGVPPTELSGFDVQDGMAPWSCGGPG